MGQELVVLLGAGFFSGLLAGLLGIGGGIVLVPVLVGLGFSPVQSVATSTLAIVLTATSGTLQNLRMGAFDWRRIVAIGIPAMMSTQVGVYLARWFEPQVLLLTFGGLLLTNIYLFEVNKRVVNGSTPGKPVMVARGDRPFWVSSSLLSKVMIGGIAGILAGLFGVGGGVIMVPLQVLLLQEPIKVAIQTSLGVIVLTSVAACLGHGSNVLVSPGVLLGLGGILGAQISTRFLPKLPDWVVDIGFRTLLFILASYTFWKAWTLKA